MLQSLPFISTVVTLGFAAAVFWRFARRGGIHLLMWGIGLTLYGLGTLAEAWLFVQYDPFWIRLWYVAGAILNPAWLGQGTVWLLVRRRGVAQALTALLAALSLFAFYWVFQLPVSATAYNLALPVSAQYKEILLRDGLTLAMLSTCAFYGTLTLVGGALYSAFIFWRKRVLPGRMLGNVLIAAGALAPALGGTLVRRGLGDVLFASELLGALLMFAGFILATRRAEQAGNKPAPQTIQSHA